MRPKTYQNAFQAGHDAYVEGKSHYSNPYNEDDPESFDWINGFFAAEELYLGVDYDG